MYDWLATPMIKKYYVLAIVSLVLIPVVTMVGATIAILIDPEIAVHYANYERNFRILNQLKLGVILASFAADIGLWVLACFFLLKSKKRSYWWLPLSVLGPFGLIALTIVRDNDPLPGDLYQGFIRSMKSIWRVAYEVGLFVLVWVGAFLSVALIGEIRIMAESAYTGTPRAQIVNVQNASSGMWAFTEGLETLGLVVLFYLTFPVLFNVAGRLYSFIMRPVRQPLT
jgi:hypothetical protein